MKNITKNIRFLKNFIEKRETYIRFSPLGTAIMGIMCILYYFRGNTISTIFEGINNDIYMFLLIGIVGMIIVTILSIFNSKNKGEKLLPKSIRYVIINLIFFGITFFIIVYFLFSKGLGIYIIPISILFYGLLIIVSRFCIPDYIKYFGFVCFIFGALSLGPLFNYINEIILLILGFGHLVMAAILNTNGKKNG